MINVNDYMLSISEIALNSINAIDNDDDFYILEVLVPGVDPDSLNIFLDFGELEIKSKDANTFIDTNNYITRQFNLRKIDQRILIPHDCNLSNVKTDFKNGLLRIKLEKLKQ